MRTSKQVLAFGCLIVAIVAACSDSGDDDADAPTTAEATDATDSAGATSVATSSQLGSDTTVSAAVTTAPSSVPAATGTLAPDAPPVCTELKRIRTLSDEISLVTGPIMTAFLNDEQDFDIQTLATVAAALDDKLPEVLDAYADAAAVAEDDTMVADIEAVSTATAEVTPVLAEVFRNAESVEDLDELEQRLSSSEMATMTISAGEASLRLDEFTIPQCGFKFSN
jgi:hypothetical protein